MPSDTCGGGGGARQKPRPEHDGARLQVSNLTRRLKVGVRCA